MVPQRIGFTSEFLEQHGYSLADIAPGSNITINATIAESREQFGEFVVAKMSVTGIDIKCNDCHYAKDHCICHPDQDVLGG